MGGDIILSDLHNVAQAVSSLVANSEDTIRQLKVCTKQVNEMIALTNNVMQGTAQREHQNLSNQLIVSQKKLEYATQNLVNVSKYGNDWVSGHVLVSKLGVSVSHGYSDFPAYAESNEIENPFKPTRSTPRDLPVSQYGFVKSTTGIEVYDSPLEVDKYLYAKQGNAYTNFKGTCGLCSCANILRLAGVDYGEKEMIDYAANTKGDFLGTRLCTVNPFNPSASGGTTPKQRQQILDYFGVSSGIWDVKTNADGTTSIDTINDIAQWISEGRGVMVDVDAGLFYNNPKCRNLGHAVTITSVEKNKYGDVTAFYILDSNQGTVKYNSWEIQEMLRNFVGINVTSQIIR